MKTKEIRRKLLAMFPDAAHAQLQPIIDSLIEASIKDGERRGRDQAATMIEQITLGSDEFAIDDLIAMKDTLRRRY